MRTSERKRARAQFMDSIGLEAGTDDAPAERLEPIRDKVLIVEMEATVED